MKTRYSQFFKISLLTFIGFLVIFTTYYYLSTKTKKYTFNYFNTSIIINLGNNQSSLSSKTINTIDKLLKDQEYKWFPGAKGDITQFNKQIADKKSFTADQEMLELINKIKYYYKTSQNYFNPTMGKLINYWGSKDKDLNVHDYLNKLPTPEDLIIKGNSVTSLNPDLQLNIEVILTAHILRQVKDILTSNGVTNAEMIMGNDIYIIKEDPKFNYRVVTQHTASKKMPTMYLRTYNNEFLSTSGILVKNYLNIVDTIVNPKTGKKADGFYGATVIDQDPYKANVASIVLIIAGPKYYESVAESLGITSYMVYSYDGKLIISQAMRDRLGS